MSDPLSWWPGKHADHKCIAELVEELLPAGEVLQYGGAPVFGEMLPDHCVTTARILRQDDITHLPYADGQFDLGVSARVLELMPPDQRPAAVRELMRVVRYGALLAIPLQPELEIIDKIQNSYVWGANQVWHYPQPVPQEIEALFDSEDFSLTFHAGCGSTTTPPFLVAEILKPEYARIPAATEPVVH